MRGFFLLLLPLLLAAWGTHAAANGLPSSPRLELDFRDAPVGKVLFELFSEHGVPAVVSENLPGSVTGRFKGSPERIARDIAKQFGLVLYHDGNVTHVTHVSEHAYAMLWLDPAVLARVAHFADVLRLLDPRFTFDASPQEGYLVLAGPPRYVARLKQLADSVKSSPPSLQGRLQTRIFKLKYASAADGFRGGAGAGAGAGAARDPAALQPGVASVLARIMDVQLVAAGSGPADPRIPAGAARRLQGALSAAGAADGRRAGAEPPGTAESGTANGPGRTAAAAVPELPSDAPSQRAGSAPPPQGIGRAGGTGAAGAARSELSTSTPDAASFSSPVVMAEPRMNAVIVRDEPSRMPAYEELIAQLDVPPIMVEIEATIIDIDSNRLEQLGVDLKVETSNVSVLASAAGRGNSLNYSQPPAVSGRGLVAATLVGNAGNSLLASVVALSQAGDAKIVSRPRIVTVNNVGAAITNTKEFNVRVAGERQADLFNVSYGLNMQVTPSVVGDSQTPEFRLLVQIEDGNSQLATVEGIPVITRSSLNTQSLVRQGDSLLIGGYVVDETSDGRDKVPFLGDLPVVGALFGERRSSRRRTERLFLITPRVVEREASAKAASRIIQGAAPSPDDAPLKLRFLTTVEVPRND